MKYWNKMLRDMDEYMPGEQPRDIEEYIKLNTNENPFPPFDSVLKAITANLNANLRRYPDARAIRVREIFAEQNGIRPENVFAGNGSDEIFTLFFRGFIEKDGTAAFPYPSYSLYCTLAQGNGIKYEKINLDTGLNLDLDKFLINKYDMVIIANPNNPTGTYIGVDKIREFVKRYRGLLVVDEAYVDFYGGSSIDLIKEFENIVITRSFSKSYSLAGLRVGLAIANEDIINGLFKLKDSYNIDTLALAGAAAALLDTRSFRYNISMLTNNKEYKEEILAGMGFETVPSRANFIFTKHRQYPRKQFIKNSRNRRYWSGISAARYSPIMSGSVSAR
jgi:histidinol-phosphate aminotransferase